jgi:hypothetical protein
MNQAWAQYKILPLQAAKYFSHNPFARGDGPSSVVCLPGEKISRKGAEAQRERCFSLCLGDFARKKLFHAKPRSREGGNIANARIPNISPRIFPQLLT